MPTIDIFNTDGKKVGTTDLDDVIFGTEVKEHLFHTVVRYQLAARRAGTHSVKGRSQVSGGGRKPFRQKGTGRARRGTNRAPQMRGGGIVHGPHPRSHAHALPKKVRRAALRCALSRRCEESKLTVFDAFDLPEIKTKNFTRVMDNFSFESVLLVLSDKDEIVSRSARNVPGVTVLPVQGLNVYDVLRHKNLAMTAAAVEKVIERLGK
ncbi:MAG: 50S ribosomal protein L4 [Myxococcota bacterium]|jgi:large subunit ribosomal protein L4|nr:50S ribosomal protein L4 [Myxococcota bacterium]